MRSFHTSLWCIAMPLFNSFAVSGSTVISRAFQALETLEPYSTYILKGDRVYHRTELVGRADCTNLTQPFYQCLFWTLRSIECFSCNSWTTRDPWVFWKQTKWSKLNAKYIMWRRWSSKDALIQNTDLWKAWQVKNFPGINSDERYLNICKRLRKNH